HRAEHAAGKIPADPLRLRPGHGRAADRRRSRSCGEFAHRPQQGGIDRGRGLAGELRGRAAVLLRRGHSAAAARWPARETLTMVARIGLIIPSSNRMVEQEMVGAFPEGVQAHVTRLRMTGANHLAFADLLPRIEDAGRALVDARCDAIAFHCTANSMEGGSAGEEQILAALSRAGAARATTTITAIQRAFDALAARRIALLTPYSAAA